MAITKIQSESLNLSDTYDFTGTVTGAGGVNTPAFFVRQSSNQSITKNTLVKLQFPTEVYDTANAFASNTFTVPSGQSGKYFFYGRIAYLTENDFEKSQFRIYVNGSDVDDGAVTSNINQDTVTFNYSLDLSVGDTVEAYTYNNYGGAEPSIVTFAGRTNFGGYKIIE